MRGHVFKPTARGAAEVMKLVKGSTAKSRKEKTLEVSVHVHGAHSRTSRSHQRQTQRGTFQEGFGTWLRRQYTELLEPPEIGSPERVRGFAPLAAR